ncbi:MAG: hypothetical protein BWY26_01241 [Elusimicrobia bacterium ADurb.Bin231]|nr:MAG: hypothetical protein BWY26_01241 [Elusimicrobia bacterium ADurb.Bin231]
MVDKYNRNLGKVLYVFCATIILSLLVESKASSEETYKRAVSKNITYQDINSSNQTNELNQTSKKQGVLSVSKGSSQTMSVGPESFTTDINGNIYICDTAGGTIQIFSPRGNYKSEISLDKNIVINDIAVDSAGRIYIYDSIENLLHQFTQDGKTAGRINISSAKIGARGPMHIVGDKIYIIDADQRDILIGKITGNVLAAPSLEELAVLPDIGINAPSGRKYFMEVSGDGAAAVKISGTNNLIRNVKVPVSGVLSATFLKEDKKGNFYVQIERILNGELSLEVYKFDFAGQYVSRIDLTDKDYFFWTVRFMDVDDRENLYQFVPGKDSGKLNIYKK